MAADTAEAEASAAAADAVEGDVTRWPLVCMCRARGGDEGGAVPARGSCAEPFAGAGAGARPPAET